MKKQKTVSRKDIVSAINGWLDPWGNPVTLRNGCRVSGYAQGAKRHLSSLFVVPLNHAKNPLVTAAKVAREISTATGLPVRFYGHKHCMVAGTVSNLGITR